MEKHRETGPSATPSDANPRLGSVPRGCELRGRDRMGSEDKEAVGYDHGYDAQIFFYLGLALD